MPAPRSSARTAVIAVVVVVITFVSGAAVGFFGAHFFPRRGSFGRSRMMPQMMVRHLSRTLDLTPEQRTKVEQIVMRHHARIVQLQESTRPQVRQELEAANREIEALLTPEQRQKFAKLRMRLGRHEGRGRREPTR
jgi:Spy/CpxP family protein refolding chaperone